jgi:N-methylhydantoinase A
MHAVFLARELEIGEVIVPPLPGAFSAWGMLETELRKDSSLSFSAPFAGADRGELASSLAEMESEGRTTLVEQGVAESAIRVEHSLDLRYEGQEYTLVVPLDGLTEIQAETFVDVVGDRFHAAHRRRFGHSNPGAPMEIVALRTTVFGDLGRPEPVPKAAEPDRRWQSERRTAVFGKTEHETETVRRVELPVGAELKGPVIVLEETATTVVPPGATMTVDPLGALVISVGE